MTAPIDHPLPANIAARFWPKVDRSAPGECWIWTGAVQWPPKAPYGYLTQKIDRRRTRRLLAHRVSYRLHKGDLGALVVRHTCHNFRCVNPAHLLAGTHADNMRDMVDAGRSTCGERNPAARLTAAQVHEIRAKRARGMLLKDIAREYGVHLATIDYACRGRNWSTL